MKKLNIFLLIPCFWLLSCSDWLDVQPKTSIPADKLFESEASFKDVLTGFYLKMGTANLYAKELSYGYLELLSCNYDNYPDIYYPDKSSIYDYDGLFEERKNSIYLDMYNIIANINNFLYYLEKNKDVIKTEHYYEMMKGEALGLRAFLHFDLLRMFGPVYSEGTEEKAIAYRKTFDQEATSLLSASDVVDNILEDLKLADSLLKDHDPLIFGVPEVNDVSYNAFTHQRQLRMNLYAVRALLARVYCYKGDEEGKAKAVSYATEVLDAPYFELSNTNDNLIMYGEHIMGLNVYDFYKVLNQYFNTNTTDGTNPNQHINITKENFDNLYEVNSGGATDFRANNLAFKDVSSDGKSYKYCMKYDQSVYNGEYSGKNIVPLIRLPEMYYIIAECETDKTKSSNALNAVRLSRGISYEDEIIADERYDKLDTREGYDGAKTLRVNEIMKEYRKEFFAEGQLFYFYKHHNYETYDRCPLSNVREKYKWAIPDNEKIFGNNK